MPSGTQTRKILIKVDTMGNRDLKALADSLGGVNKNTKSLAQNVTNLKNVFLGYLGAIGVREIANLSDEMQRLSNQLKVVARAGEDTRVIMKNLVDLANETNQSVSSVATVYTRLANSMKNSGASSGALLNITKSLINTFRLSGSTGTETTNTIIQLSQAFTSGEVRGQELRSILEQNAVIAGLLAEKYAKVGGALKAGEKGMIKASDILRLLYENQDRLNESAKLLAPTFGETLTKSLNSVQYGLLQINEQFQLSAKFAVFMEVAINSLGTVLGAVGGLLVAWGVAYIPTLIKQIKALRVAFLAFASANPLLLLFTALSVSAGVLIANWDKVSRALKVLKANFYEIFADFILKLDEWQLKIERLFNLKPTNMTKQVKETSSALKKAAMDLRKEIELSDKKNAANGAPTDGKKDLEDLIKRLEEMGAKNAKLAKIKEILGEINQEFLKGSINVEEYNQKLVNFELYKLNREFKEGKFDIFTYNQRLAELNVQSLNRDLKNGVITLREFRDAVESSGVEELNAKFQAGKVGVIEYNQELIKISEKFQPGGSLIAGTASYIESIGTVSENVADAIKKTFSAVEDSFVEFTKTGKFNFASMTSAILEDLTRIIIRASIIRPIAQGILGAAAGGADIGDTGRSMQYNGATPDFSAKGNAFGPGGKLHMFARGGVVNGATGFGFGNGKMGVMGEAGPEAILPLQRGSGGNLGVAATVTPVTVNIINQSSSEVQQSERTGPNGEKSLDILIVGKVKDAFISGQLDGTMKSAYNLQRRGS